jgi:hypothetical protein
MATVVNYIDVTLQSAPARTIVMSTDVDGYLTRSAVVLAAATDGTVSDFSPAAGTFKVSDAGVDKTGTTDVTYSVAAQAGCTVAITAAGVYSVSAMSIDNATATLRAVYGGVTLDKNLSLAKAKGGATGSGGLNVGTFNAYKRAAAAPTDNPGNVTVDFSTGQITTTTLANGWSKNIPAANGNPLYVEAISGSASGTTASLLASGWSGAGMLSQDGVAGLNVYAVQIYQRSADATPLALPSAATNLTFATGVLTGLNNGWSQSVPAFDAAKPYLQMSVATASAAAATDSIAPSEWATPVGKLWAASLPDLGFHGDLNATNDLVLVPGTYVTVSGNTITKTAGVVDWNADCNSQGGYVGGAFASVVAGNAGGNRMFGLNTDPSTGSGYNSLDRAIYLRADGYYDVYESGASATAGACYGTYSAIDVFDVTYDGSNFRYLRNGAVFRTVAATVTAPLFFDCSIYSLNSGFKNVRFGPMSDVSAGVAAKAATDAISSDSVLSKGEKRDVVQRWNTCDNERASLDPQADSLAVSRTNYDAAHEAMSIYLVSLSPAWNDTTQDTPIDPTTWKSKWNTYFDEKQKLINALAAKAATLSTWAGTTGAGRPDDYATYLPPGKGSAINDDPTIDKPSAWHIDTGITIQAGTNVAGAVCNKYFYTPGTGSGTNLFAYSLRRYVVDSAKTYSLTAMLYASSGNNRNMYLYVNFYDAAGAQITGTGWGGSMSGYVYGGTPPADTWTRQGAQFGAGTGRNIPANTRSVEIGVWFQYSDGTSSVSQGAQDIRLEQVISTALIDPSFQSTLSDKISKTAGGILSGPVSIATNGSIVSGTLTVDANGNRTSGFGTAQTPKGWAGYNSSGVATIVVDALTGEALFGGALSAVTGNFNTLTIASGGWLRSSNYVAGSAGLTLNGDGSAELSILSLRGAPTGPVSGSASPLSTTETSIVTLGSATAITQAHIVTITISGYLDSPDLSSGAAIVRLYSGDAAGSETTQIKQWSASSTYDYPTSTWVPNHTTINESFSISVPANSSRTGAGKYFKVTAYRTGSSSSNTDASATISTNIKGTTT